MRWAMMFLLGAAATATAAADENFPQKIPAPGGEVQINSAFERDVLYNQWHFAPLRRAGDFAFLSGVVAGPRQDDAKTIEGFKAQLRRTFEVLQAQLKAANLTFADVVEIQTFHVFASPHFQGAKQDHIAAFSAVKDEFVKPPYPTWTAIGVDALVPDTGLVEIQITAYAPAKRSN